MPIIAAAAASAAASAAITLVLPPIIEKLASKFGGDVTPEEMELLKTVDGYLIEELIRKVKHGHSDESKQLLKKLQVASFEVADLFDMCEYDQLEKQVSTFSSDPITKFKHIFKENSGTFLPKSSSRDRLEKLQEFLKQVKEIKKFITCRRNTTQLHDDTITRSETMAQTKDSLLQSYIGLPKHLYNCFTYCILFPKGYKFCIDFHEQEPHLISLWIAHGYIESTDGLTLEEVGKKYFMDLVSQSFFEKTHEDHFVIPDLLHDLVKSASANLFHRVEDSGSLNIPETCIHLSFCTKEKFVGHSVTNVKAKISKLQNLHTLIILSGHALDDIFQNGKGILPKLITLRALYVYPGQLMGVQSIQNIDKLKLLRYLHVQYHKQLPKPLAKLYLLNIFILITDRINDHKYLEKDTLPKDFDNLIRLRTLKFYASSGNELDYLYHNSEMIDVSKLESLQNLMAFHPDKDGSKGMMALRNLPLCGSLSILNLEEVQSKEEAGLAMLNQKKSLNELIFEWSSSSNDNLNKCEEVLDALEPHNNLKKLEIKGYKGVKFPTWMKNCLLSLQTLTLSPCQSHEIGSSLPPCLQSLDVSCCNEDCEVLQLSFVGEVGRTFNLRDFPKRALPSMFKVSLGFRRLTIKECSIDDLDLSFLTDLESLYVGQLPKLHTITNLSPTVSELTIEDCPKLTSLENLQRCTSLKYLEIYKCPMLKREEASLSREVVGIASRFPEVKSISTDEPLLVFELVQQQAFRFIKCLDLTGCAAIPNLETLSLKSLCVEDSPDVELLPNLPVSLQLLWIYRCPKLKEKYEEGAPLRDTISHIPHIDIS